MELFAVTLISALVSGLTLFSGFGLGTVMLPLFSVFFPIEVAVGMTAIVHLLNNLFKMVLLGTSADKRVVMAFGLPAMFAASLGAWVLLHLVNLPSLFTYKVLGEEFLIEPAKMVIGMLMLLFAAFELAPRKRPSAAAPEHLIVGGLISGFFGGLSGHQGAFRSVFLVHANLSKESFIATGVVIASVVDLSRLAIYGTHLAMPQGQWPMLICAIVGAFAGAVVGNHFLAKVTMRTIRTLIAVMMCAIALALMLGLL